MSEQIISKRCSKCKDTKPLSEFGKRPDSPDGYRNDCKQCKYKRERVWLKRQTKTPEGIERQREYQRNYQKRYCKTEKAKSIQRKAARRFRIRHPKQYAANQAVQAAIKAGQLPRPDSLQCHYCPAQATQYHHHKGYEPEHWLDVVPVCQKCHNNLK